MGALPVKDDVIRLWRERGLSEVFEGLDPRVRTKSSCMSLAPSDRGDGSDGFEKLDVRGNVLHEVVTSCMLNMLSSQGKWRRRKSFVRRTEEERRKSIKERNHIRPPKPAAYRKMAARYANLLQTKSKPRRRERGKREACIKIHYLFPNEQLIA